MSERLFLTPEQAMSVMSWHEYDEDGTEAVHTFIGGGMMLVGADHIREDVERDLSSYKPEILGPQARAMGHGVGVVREDGLLAYATDEGALEELERTVESTP